MSRLPTIGGDDGSWGQVLNDFLSVSHNPDGSIKPSSIPASASPLGTKTSNYAMTTADGVILVDATAGPVIITLPAAAGNDGFRATIKKIDTTAHIVTIAPAGSETIDGNANLTISAPYTSIELISDGANWFVL